MSSNPQDYIKQLEAFIGQCLAPIKNAPFPVVIGAIAGVKVKRFSEIEDEMLVLQKLKAAATDVVRKNKVYSKRANEAGNKIEPFVVAALVKQGLRASKPTTKTKKKQQTMGYPDIEIILSPDQAIYVDCKTDSKKTEGQGMRSFYLSPSRDPKITRDGAHLLISFELEQTDIQNDIREYTPRHWKIVDLHDLELDLKHEFNADNPRLYKQKPNMVIAEGP